MKGNNQHNILWCNRFVFLLSSTTWLYIVASGLCNRFCNSWVANYTSRGKVWSSQQVKKIKSKQIPENAQEITLQPIWNILLNKLLLSRRYFSLARITWFAFISSNLEITAGKFLFTFLRYLWRVLFQLSRNRNILVIISDV